MGLVYVLLNFVCVEFYCFGFVKVLGLLTCNSVVISCWLLFLVTCVCLFDGFSLGFVVYPMFVIDGLC